MLDSTLIEEFSELYDDWLHQYDMTRSYDIAYMASGIAHEIRNPLSLIRTTLQLIELQKDPEVLEQKLPLIYRELNRIDTLISEFMDFSSSKQCEFQWVDINGLLEEIYDLFETTMKEKNIDFHMNLHKKSPMILGDEKRLKQVFVNLIKNAFEATYPHGFVYIHATMDHRFLHISIKDSGIGMSKEDLDRIFTPFYTTKTTGTGLGLPIVKEIVELHGGSLSLYTNPGNGSEFIVSIPVTYRFAPSNP